MCYAATSNEKTMRGHSDQKHALKNKGGCIAAKVKPGSTSFAG